MPSYKEKLESVTEVVADLRGAHLTLMDMNSRLLVDGVVLREIRDKLQHAIDSRGPEIDAQVVHRNLTKAEAYLTRVEIITGVTPPESSAGSLEERTEELVIRLARICEVMKNSHDAGVQMLGEMNAMLRSASAQGIRRRTEAQGSRPATPSGKASRTQENVPRAKPETPGKAQKE